MDELLEAFAETFYGYGSYGGQYWFIGLEEGGGGSAEEIGRRLSAWDRRGRRELDDVAEYHREIGVGCYFGPRARLQTTLKQLARMALAADGLGDTTEAVRTYQGAHLGRRGGDSCLLELLPLPSPSTARWGYGERSMLPQLASREKYRQRYVTMRAGRIKERIHEFSPRVVFFYGVAYQATWTHIAGTSMRRIGADLWVGSRAGTTFVIAKHPASYGVSNDYFREAGKLAGSMSA